MVPRSRSTPASTQERRSRRDFGGAPRFLELTRHENAPLGAHGGSAVLPLDATTHVPHTPPESIALLDTDHEPFEANPLVRVNRPAEPHPELEAQHGGV